MALNQGAALVGLACWELTPRSSPQLCEDREIIPRKLVCAGAGGGVPPGKRDLRLKRDMRMVSLELT